MTAHAASLTLRPRSGRAIARCAAPQALRKASAIASLNGASEGSLPSVASWTWGAITLRTTS